jgi:hypothetical protein
MNVSLCRDRGRQLAGRRDFPAKRRDHFMKADPKEKPGNSIRELANARRGSLIRVVLRRIRPADLSLTQLAL